MLTPDRQALCCKALIHRWSQATVLFDITLASASSLGPEEIKQLIHHCVETFVHVLTEKRVKKFAEDFGIEGDPSVQFEHYVAAAYLFPYVQDNVELIQRAVLGGGNDEGIDIAAVVVNGQLVFEPEEVDESIADQNTSSAKVIFIQAKTSQSFDSKLIAKFLHGVEIVSKHAMKPQGVALAPRLVDIAHLIERIAENGDKFQDYRIPCELYYVTTSSSGGASSKAELQISEAMRRIIELDCYSEDLVLNTHGHEKLAGKQKERYGPRNVQFNFEKRQTIPATAHVTEAYIGLLSAAEIIKLLKDGNGSVRPGIFDDNVRLDLGENNSVNQKIMETLEASNRNHFPFLNNGLTIIATELRGTGDRFFISGYQVVNGGQTSHQLIRWSETETVKQNSNQLEQLWVPVKIVSTSDPQIRSSVAVATNLQTAIDAANIQASSKIAKDVEEYFAQSGPEGLRYERQNRGTAIDFARTRVLSTSDLNRAVAATAFGESSRAIASPKSLESEDSFVWGSYPVEMYYYSAWILYRIDRYFSRTPDRAVLKAAKYHIAMMVSVIVNPEFSLIFENGDTKRAAYKLEKPRRLTFQVTKRKLADDIESAIVTAMQITADFFGTILSQGRSLRKDDVRSRQHQEALLAKAKVIVTDQ